MMAAQREGIQGNERSKTNTSWRKNNKNNKNSCQKWLKNKNKKYQ